MRRERQANAAVPGCGFHHVAIRTADWDRSLKFWQEAMGFQLAVQWNEPPRRAWMLDTGDGQYLAVFERAPEACGAGARRWGFTLPYSGTSRRAAPVCWTRATAITWKFSSATRSLMVQRRESSFTFASVRTTLKPPWSAPAPPAPP